MKRNLTTKLGLCLLVVALIVLAVAPAASAGAPVVRWTALETFAEPPNIVAQTVIGDIAVIKMANHLIDYDALDASGKAYPAGSADIYTRGTWVANIVGGAPADSVMHGTYRSYSADGSVWRGTWAGTMDMQTYAMEFVSWGRCVSGPFYGYVLSQHGTSEGYGAPTMQSYTAFKLGWCWLK